MLTVVAVIGILECGLVLHMPDNDLWYCGPWTLWVMAGRGVASGAECGEVIALRRPLRWRLPQPDWYQGPG